LLGLSATNDYGALLLNQGGTRTIQIQAVNETYFNAGNVGIGTTGPTSPLVVKGASGASNDASGVGGVLRLSTGTGLGTDESLIFGVHDTDYSWIQATKPGTAARNLSLQQLGGNVGIGTTSPQDKLEVAGSIRVTDTSQAVSAWALSRNGAAERGAGAMAVYNGYLYAGQGTSAGSGDVFYFDGSSWNTSRDGTEEFILSMAVFNGKLYVGQGTGGGDADIFVCNPATAGDANICDNASDWTTAYDGSATYELVISMAVYNGKLYAGLGQSAAGDGDIIVCNPATAGDATTCDNASDWTTSLDNVGTYEEIDSLAVFNGTLYAGTGNGAGEGDVFRCIPTGGGDAATCDNAADWAVHNIDAGASDRVRAMAVYNGKLYASTGYITGGDGDIFVCVPTLTGDEDTCDATTDWGVYFDAGAAVEEISALAVYNGKLYAGLGRSADGDGDVYVFNGAYWALSYAGAADLIDSLAVYNGKLYMGQGLTAGEGDIYTYTEARAATYPIKFSIGTGTSQNLGNMWFENDDEYGTSGGPGSNIGAFKLSHALITTAGLYDVVEDYPTYDATLSPGEIVAVDPYSAGYVTKADAGDRAKMVGVISTDPGIRLSQESSSGHVPVALLGRVPVRVDPNGPTFSSGDSLTISPHSGKAAKAGTAGR